MIEIVIPGEPVPKTRPRFRKNGFTYDPQKKQLDDVKLLILAYLREKHFDVKFPLEGAIGIELEFQFEPAQSDSKHDKNHALWNIREHVHAPDIDNLEKFYLDAMNAVVYHDDRQIKALKSKKSYSKIPQTVIRIMKEERILLPDVENLLGMISPDEFDELTGEMEVLSESLFWSKEPPSEMQREDQIQAARLLSLFAEKYAPILAKITKKYPKLHKKIEEVEGTLYKKEICSNYPKIPTSTGS